MRFVALAQLALEGHQGAALTCNQLDLCAAETAASAASVAASAVDETVVDAVDAVEQGHNVAVVHACVAAAFADWAACAVAADLDSHRFRVQDHFRHLDCFHHLHFCFSPLLDR